MNIIYNMPRAAREAFEAAHQQRAGNTGMNRTTNKQTDRGDYRLTLDYMQYRDDEKKYRDSRKNSRRGDIEALNAKTFLHTQRTPKLTACRLLISQVKEAAGRASIARARDPQRVRAAQIRHMNTVNYTILKERGYK